MPLSSEFYIEVYEPDITQKVIAVAWYTVYTAFASKVLSKSEQEDARHATPVLYYRA